MAVSAGSPGRLVFMGRELGVKPNPSKFRSQLQHGLGWVPCFQPHHSPRLPPAPEEVKQAVPRQNRLAAPGMKSQAGCPHSPLG